MEVTSRTVTPELAERWLGLNTRNRHIRPAVVGGYTEAMRAGQWRTDIDPIAFTGDPDDLSTHPVLLNGQHRLAAISASDVALEMLVATGLEPEDQVEMDTGTRRMLADQLRLRGHANVVELASTLRMAYLYEHGYLRGRSVIPSYTALLTFFEDNPDLIDTVPYARKLYNAIGGRLSVYGVAYWVLARLEDPSVGEDLEEWWHLLASGENLAAGSPALALRQNILATHTPGVRIRRVSQVQLLATFFKAWNAWRLGATLTSLVWRGGGKTPEAFPVPE